MSACTASPEPWKPLNAASGSRAAEESASAAFFKTLRSAPRARRSACARPAASVSSADSGTTESEPSSCASRGVEGAEEVVRHGWKRRTSTLSLR
jgi:hypothetical protein